MSLMSAAGQDLQEFVRFPADYIHPVRASDWLPDLPESLACSIAANPRLRSKVSSIILAAYRLQECPEPLDPADAAIAVLPFDALTRVAVIAGSIWNANWVRHTVDRSLLAEIFGKSGLADYTFAISHAHLAGPRSDPATTGHGLATVVFTDGFGCLLNWVSSLPAPFSGRIWLKIPRGYGQPLPEGCSPETAQHIIRTASQYIQSCL